MISQTPFKKGLLNIIHTYIKVAESHKVFFFIFNLSTGSVWQIFWLHWIFETTENRENWDFWVFFFCFWVLFWRFMGGIFAFIKVNLKLEPFQVFRHSCTFCTFFLDGKKWKCLLSFSHIYRDSCKMSASKQPQPNSLYISPALHWWAEAKLF